MDSKLLAEWVRGLQEQVDEHLRAEHATSLKYHNRDLHHALALSEEQYGGLPEIIFVPRYTLRPYKDTDSYDAGLDAGFTEDENRQKLFMRIPVIEVYGCVGIRFAPQWWPTPYAVARLVDAEESQIDYHERRIASIREGSWIWSGESELVKSQKLLAQARNRIEWIKQNLQREHGRRCEDER